MDLGKVSKIVSRAILTKIGAKNKLKNKPIQATKPADIASISSVNFRFKYLAMPVRVRVNSQSIFLASFNWDR
jgi:hypothetical protein